MKMSRRKKFIFYSLLFFMVFSACLVAGEITLRSATRLHYVYNAGMFFLPDYLSRHYKYKYLATYEGRKKLNTDMYNPILGWDYNKDNNGIRGPETYSLEKPPGITRIVAIGDSFTHGNEVESHECFPYLVGTMLEDTEVLNMGVGGYDIGQPYIKYKTQGHFYNPDIVIFGILSNDLDRTGLSFFSHAKPVFRFDKNKGSLVLENTPVARPEKALEDAARSSLYELRLAVFLKNWYYHIPAVQKRAIKKYYMDIGIVVKSILSALKTELEASGKKLLIINIPPGGEFASDRAQSIGKKKSDVFLMGIYEQLELDYIDLSEVFMKRAVERQRVFNEYYIHRNTGVIGHMTPEGNMAAAEAIVDYISSAGWADVSDHTPGGDSDNQ